MDLAKIGKLWTPDRGQSRYYINNWMDLIGLTVYYYNTGNVSCVEWKDGTEMSNNHYKRYIQNTKVWIGAEDRMVHIDYCDDARVKNKIAKAVEGLLEGGTENEGQ